MTICFWALTACVYGLILLWMGTLQQGLIILAVPILVYLASAILYAPGEVQVNLQRKISAAVVNQNEPVTVDLRFNYSGPGVDQVLLAEAFPAVGHRVSLLTYGYGLERVFPGVGKVQRERILRALARAQVGSNYALESLNYLPTRLFPARSQLVIISPVGNKDYPVFVRIREEGYTMLLVSPDPVAFEVQTYTARVADARPEIQSDCLDLAMRLARLERELMLQKLLRLGIHVVNWDVAQSFEQVITANLNRLQLFLRHLKRFSI